MISDHDVSVHELDLHEKTWTEALPEFIAFYNEAIQRTSGGPPARLNVIHGYGSSGTGGVLRKRLQNFLKEHALQGRLEFTAGEHTDANPGHTLVVPIQPLLALDELLSEEIWAYCTRPRTLSKISGKFRRHGAPTVITAIDSLVKQRRLRVIGKGNRKTHEAV